MAAGAVRPNNEKLLALKAAASGLCLETVAPFRVCVYVYIYTHTYIYMYVHH